MIRDTDIDNDLPRLRTIIDRAEGEHKDYQYEGVRWCLAQEECGVSPAGGLLADEMGLGKTLTMLGTLMENFQPRTLLVMPVALLTQWRDQIHRFTGHWPLVFHGRGKHVDDSVLLNAPIVLASYAAISFNKKKQNFSRLHKVRWNRVIFDEAHHLRNAKTAKFAGAAELHTDIRWLVTGTPIQNRKRDIVSLGLLVGVTSTQLVDSKMLRRTKEEVGLSLLPLVEHTQDVLWTSDEERDLAEEFHTVLEFSNVDPSRSGIVSRSMGADELPLVSLTRAKQICTMPSLLTHRLADLVEKEVIDETHPRLRGATFTSKLDAVVDQLMYNQHNGAAKLVFCTYRQEMDFLQSALAMENVSAAIVDGRSKKALAKTQDGGGPSVLILQVQTCCEGLNLQAYSEVYFVTPHWNPFVEKQAVARCHRFGQQKEVHVYRFFMDSHSFAKRKGASASTQTFDNHVCCVQKEKMGVAQEVLGHVSI